MTQDEIEITIDSLLEGVVMDLLAIYNMSKEVPLLKSTLDSMIFGIRSQKDWAVNVYEAYKKHSAETLTGGRYG